MTRPIGEARKPFVRQLRKMGFGKLEFAFAGALLAMEKTVGDRTVSVQLWNDSAPPLLRASMGVAGKGECTLPTVFSTVGGMVGAVAHEFMRKQDRHAPQVRID